MQNDQVTPEIRSPQSLLLDLRRSAARVEAAVACALVISTCSLLFAIVRTPLA